MTEAVLDTQLLELIDRIRIQNQNVREWLFVWPSCAHSPATQAMRGELQRQLTIAQGQQDRLINM